MQLTTVVIEGIWIRYPDAGPPAMTVMKVSYPRQIRVSKLTA